MSQAQARLPRPREASLYPAVKRFLATRGYDAKGEVGTCDIVATNPADPTRLVIVEMKLGLTLDLLLQAVDRLPCADELWLAVPTTRRGRDRDPRAVKLCRLLGFGLLAIALSSGTVTVLSEPTPYRPRPDLRRRAALLKEHGARRGDPSPGGTRGVPVMTAYRQEALACAARLQEGSRPTRTLSDISPRATKILYRNVYGWFERQGRGLYGLTPSGQAALAASLPPPTPLEPDDVQRVFDQGSLEHRQQDTAQRHLGPSPHTRPKAVLNSNSGIDPARRTRHVGHRTVTSG